MDSILELWDRTCDLKEFVADRQEFRREFRDDEISIRSEEDSRATTNSLLS
jgi:hypothetical protein